jgi:hypothetical protein
MARVTFRMSLAEYIKDLFFVANPVNIARYLENKRIEQIWEMKEWPERYMADHRTINASLDRCLYEMSLKSILGL